MAYADYTFYTKEYFGNAVPESDFPRCAERASDWIDTITFDHIQSEELAEEEKAMKRIRKAVCAMAEILYQMDLAQRQAINIASCTGATGKGGIITSRSAGSESISYASPQQMGTGAKEWSAVYSAAGDAQKTKELMTRTALPYLMGIRTKEGMPVLYAGV
jgi:hypothetical protein|nr:MAG TPA: Head Tail Connector Protein [Caudoviricetes sp.]